MTSAANDPRYEALAELALGSLGSDERAAIEGWVSKDPAARAELRALEQVIVALGAAAGDVDPPAHLRDRVLAIAATAAGAARDPMATPNLADTSIRAEGPSRWSRAGWLVAAAAILAVVGLTMYTARLSSQLRSLFAQLEVTSTRLANVEAQLRDSRSQFLRARLETSVLSAPDLQQVDLAAQDSAPRARARAFLSRARGIVLTAASLPQLPAERTYQLWMLTTGAPSSVGTFQADPSGGVSAVFDMPTSVRATQGLAVSVEPAGGVPAPTGAIVLMGAAE